MKEIVNAKDYKVSELEGALPDVAGAVQELLVQLVVEVAQKQVSGGYTDELPLQIKTKISMQPFTAQRLSILPEGQRAWRWFTVYALKNLDLAPDDVVKIRGLKYRIMEKTDWHEYGYFKYDAIEDYTDAS